VPISISDEHLEKIKAAMPELPATITKKLVNDYKIAPSEAAVLADDADLYQYFNASLQTIEHPKSLINWLTGSIRAFLSDHQIDIATFPVNPSKLSALINLVDNKRVSQQVALQKLLPALLENPEQQVEEIAKELNLFIEENSDELARFVDEVLNKFQAQVQAYKKGKKGVLGLFVGEVMKLAKGKADPKSINEILLQRLNS
jgi:aspartyl-tRNA(Asn)/glutamyl-tRNA(Gln) amidotransferase subunit B